MTDTKKKTVVKASAGKQVKASATKLASVDAAAPPKAAEKPKAAPNRAAAKPAEISVTFATAPPQHSKKLLGAPAADEVARKAYEIFVREGHRHGQDQEHWFRAEAELRGASA